MHPFYQRWLSGIRSRLILLTLLSMIPVALVIIHTALETRRITTGQAIDNLNTLAIFVQSQLEARGHDAPSLSHYFDEIPFSAFERHSGLRTSTLTLWSRDGHVLARFPDAAGMVGADASGSALFRAIRQHGGPQGNIEVEGLDGILRWYAYTLVGLGDDAVILSLGQPSSQVLAEVNTLFERTLLLLAAVFSFALGVAWLVGEIAVRRPVGRLASTAQRISDGQLNVRVGELQGASELATLADAFDRMVEHLQRYEQEQEAVQQALSRAKNELEGKVRERTDQLAQASNAATDRAATLEQQRREMTILNELTDLLQSCRTLEETRPIIRRALSELFEGAPGTLYLFGESGSSLERTLGWGDGHEQMAAAFTQDDCWGLRLGRTWSYQEGTRNPACAHTGSEAPGDYICAPMHAEGKTLGILHLANRSDQPAAPARNARLVEATAARLGLALSNIKLREALRNLSIRDPLTGLYNRRFVEEVFDHEIQRCQRSDKPLSVLMVDVDHFKRFNDTHGHEAGDVVLSSVGRLLQSHFRDSDLPCRLGGEEFLAILPEADGETARQRAEGLRQAIEGLALFHQGKGLGTVTASIGVATWPQPIADPTTLIDAADVALYNAKHAGRNRVMRAGDEPATSVV